jgi:hypothetical protein
MALSPASKLRMVNCVTANVAAAVLAACEAPTLAEFQGFLHLGPGPLVALKSAPSAASPLRVVLVRSTLRGADAVVESPLALDGQSPSVTIDAASTVLAPARRGALVALASADEPTHRSFARVVWEGEGSILSEDAALVAWRDPRDGMLTGLDDSLLACSGLVRGAMQFAAHPDDGPAASRLVRWTAPARSQQPPGIGSALHLPNAWR